MVRIAAGNVHACARRPESRQPFFGPGFTDDFNDIRWREGLGTSEAIAKAVDRRILHGLGRQNYARHAITLPYVVDRNELVLLRRMGVHAAAAITIGTACGQKGIGYHDDTGTSWPWILLSMKRPTRGGRVVDIMPSIGTDIRKVDRTLIVRAVIPETVARALSGLRGERLERIVQHPALEPLELRITSVHADTVAGRIYVRTDYRHDDVAMSMLTPEDFDPLPG